VILETLGGKRSVAKACKELGIEEARYHQLKLQALAAAVAGLEAGVPGRPRKEEPAESAQVKALLEERKRLLFELQIARTREEIAVALPRVLTGQEAAKPASPAEKKNDAPAPDHHETGGDGGPGPQGLAQEGMDADPRIAVDAAGVCVGDGFYATAHAGGWDLPVGPGGAGPGKRGDAPDSARV
jgi:hypothetical protein